jgi:hypothetical protein
VFSTTLKVLLALFIISALLGVGYNILSTIGHSAGRNNSSSDFTHAYLNSRSYYNDKADDAHTKVPLSQWKRAIAQDIRHHCIHEGMTSDEVEQAVGKPTEAKTVTYGTGPGGEADKGDVWTYTVRKPIQRPCSRYEGEKCADPVEYETTTGTLYFSPKGNLTYPYLNGPLKEDVADAGSSYCD